jgi:3-phosphoglycerate kinase
MVPSLTTTRILAHLDTIQCLREAGARITLVSHLGRPKGKVSPEFSLTPVAYRLAELTRWDVGFVEECSGPSVAEAVSTARPGLILVLENLRFTQRKKRMIRFLLSCLQDPLKFSSWMLSAQLTEPMPPHKRLPPSCRLMRGTCFVVRSKSSDGSGTIPNGLSP